MSGTKKILAISGSTRKNSTNLNLIHAIAGLSTAGLALKLYEGLAEIPPFNPDLDTGHPPKQVAEFRKSLAAADGILICTPEYAMGVPGTLKNAIDWTVSSCEFSNKPVALITASSLGEKAHESLLGTLHIIEARVADNCQLLISNAKTKVNDTPQITDEKTLHAVKNLMTAFVHALNV